MSSTTVAETLVAPMTSSVPPAAPGPLSHADKRRLYQPLLKRLPALVAYSIVALTLLLGWQNRAAEILEAENGLGYALGIIGGSAMLLLLIYPLRKRVSSLRHIGGTRAWFKVHMVLGVLGPTAILFHSNFSMGSINSSVALWSMLVVAVSGSIGRYLYTKIHYGLYGQQADLRRLRQDYKKGQLLLPRLLDLPEAAHTRLEALGEIAISNKHQTMGRFFTLCLFGAQTHVTMIRTRRSVARELRRIADAKNWSSKRRQRVYRALTRRVGIYLSLVRRIAGFTLFERLFSLWHVLHIPLFIILVISAIVHVVVVHAY
jgi:hypothetical protein